MKKEILGIKIDDVNIDQAVQIIFGWLNVRQSKQLSNSKHYVVTPNPEIIVMAQKDKELKKILNKADLSVPDGVGLKIATDVVCYTPGIDLMEELIKQSQDYGFTIGLLGGGRGVAEKAADCLRKKYSKVRIVYADSGGEVNQEGKLLKPLKELKLLNCDILFVGFGPPKQEKWVEHNLKDLPIKVAMVVGGSLDFLSGEVKRAPKFIRAIGLEWLFRLIVQPWRIKRQLKLIEFLWLLSKGR